MKGIILDVETTGIDRKDEIVELAISDLDGNILFYSRIKPTVSMSAMATRLNGITDNMLKNEPSIIDVLQKIEPIVRDADKIYCWSEDFVINKLIKTAHSMNADFETIKLIRKRLVDVRSIVSPPERCWPRMDAVAYNYGIEWEGKRYSSTNDCLVISKLINKLRDDKRISYVFD
ncbi:3'-5' exonuclease [Acidomonas methanolica]|uniref:3'-5' exonuclease n=1 Tax=Acidomonas methanolica TaxID=437 RepID=UPI0004724230|nr:MULTISPECIES: 3'-5' exonuclease [Acetobacteraceae]MCQ9156040.1 3'-5' exonuclease [Acidomonas methanolica]